LLCTTAIAGLLLLPFAGAMAKTPKDAPIMTRWAADVNTAGLLPEYPRPQMVRKQWMNLNGAWQLQSGLDGDPVPTGKGLSGRIIVPFAVESAISGVLQYFDRAGMYQCEGRANHEGTGAVFPH
jgi:hypothetical protein